MSLKCICVTLKGLMIITHMVVTSYVSIVIFYETSKTLSISLSHKNDSLFLWLLIIILKTCKSIL